MSLASVAFLLIHLLTTSKCNLLLIIIVTCFVSFKGLSLKLHMFSACLSAYHIQISVFLYIFLILRVGFGVLTFREIVRGHL